MLWLYCLVSLALAVVALLLAIRNQENQAFDHEQRRRRNRWWDY